MKKSHQSFQNVKERISRRGNRLYGKRNPHPEESQSYHISKNLINIRFGRFEFVLRII